MKILLTEIFRVYKKAPAQITFIWFLDVLESFIIISTPYIIGNCIDGLLKKDFLWLGILVIAETIFGISRTVNKFFDTRLYSNIVEEESYTYYSRMIKTQADSSIISARLDLVDDVPNFLEIDFFQILNMIGGIVTSLVFLYLKSSLLVFTFAVIISVSIPLATYKFQIKINKNNDLRKNLEETRITQITRRDKYIYKQFIKNLLGIGISNSDLDAKIFFITNFLQMILLITSILSITHMNDFTSGLLFSTITYVEMLNDHVSSINDNLILLHDLKETTSRLKELPV